MSAPVRKGAVADARLGLARCPIFNFFFIILFYRRVGQVLPSVPLLALLASYAVSCIQASSV